MFGTQQKLVTPTSAHYAVTLARMDKLQAGNVKVTLVAMTTYISDKMKSPWSLISHPPPKKLLKAGLCLLFSLMKAL